MAVPSYADARLIIHPVRERRIVTAFAAGWSDWLVCPQRGWFSRWPRTRANMVFERVVDHLQRQFADDVGVRFVFDDETMKMVLDDRIVLRVKKANALGLGSNIQTQAVIDFVDAQPDLPGLEGLTKLEIVYVLNAIQTEIRSVIVQARDGDMKIYSYPIDVAAEGSGTVVPLPLPPAPPTGDDYADDLVRPKKEPGRQRADDSKPD